VASTDSPKSLIWIASSKRDLRTFPDSVKDVVGYALYLAQIGRKHEAAKPLKGFGGAGVLEIVEDSVGGTYRAVYTVRLAGVLYVLHCFQKKSKHGVETPKAELELVKQRLALAYEDYRARMKEKA
jgi:phage-related protein